MNRYIQQYTCDNGATSRIVIPNDATEDDLKGIAETLDVIIRRHFKIRLRAESEDEDGKEI